MTTIIEGQLVAQIKTTIPKRVNKFNNDNNNILVST